MSDPIKSARVWVAENPQAPGAIHVLTALGSAERYRLLAEIAADPSNTGARVVICTLPIGDGLILTSVRQNDDERIADLLGAALYGIGFRSPKPPIPLVWWRLAANVLRAHIDGEVSRRCDDFAWPEWFPAEERAPLVKAMADANERDTTGDEKAAIVEEMVENYASSDITPGSCWLASFFLGLIREMGGRNG